jgi:hypothetical protein
MLAGCVAFKTEGDEIMGTKLVAGQKYDIASLDFTGWSNGSRDYGGVCWQEWFTDSSVYRGPDDEGIEPLFDVPEFLYYVAATAASGEGLHADEVLGQYARTYFVDSGDAQAAVEELEEDSDELVGPGITYDAERIRFDERVESYKIVPSSSGPEPRMISIHNSLETWSLSPEVGNAVSEAESKAGYVAQSYDEYAEEIDMFRRAVEAEIERAGHSVVRVSQQSVGIGAIVQGPWFGYADRLADEAVFDAAVEACRDDFVRAVARVATARAGEQSANTPAPYRWDGQALYSYDEASNAYIHCFASIYVTDEAEAIRLYEARKAAAEID